MSVFPSRRGYVFDEHVEVLFLLVFAISRNEGVFAAVEDVEESLVEWHAGAEDGAEHDLVGDDIVFHRGERSGDFFFAVVERVADFVGYELADAFKIAAEAQAVVLDVDVAELHHVLVDD